MCGNNKLGYREYFLIWNFFRLFDTVQESAILKFIIKRKTKRRKKENKTT